MSQDEKGNETYSVAPFGSLSSLDVILSAGFQKQVDSLASTAMHPGHMRR